MHANKILTLLTNCHGGIKHLHQKRTRFIIFTPANYGELVELLLNHTDIVQRIFQVLPHNLNSGYEDGS